MKQFESWADVLAYAKTGAPLYYKAPMDHRAIRLTPSGASSFPFNYQVRGGKIRVWPPGSVGRGKHRTSDPFTANAGHLDRFSRTEEARGVGEKMRAHRAEPRDPVIEVGDKVRAIEDNDTGRVLKIQVPGENVPDGVPEYAGHDGQPWYWVGWDTGTRTWIGENDIELISRAGEKMRAQEIAALREKASHTPQETKMHARGATPVASGRYSSRQSSENALVYDVLLDGHHKIGYLSGPYSYGGKRDFYRWRLDGVSPNGFPPFGLSPASGEAKTKQAALNAVIHADQRRRERTDSAPGGQRLASKSRLDGGSAENFRKFLETTVIIVGGEVVDNNSIDPSSDEPVAVAIVCDVTSAGRHLGAISATQGGHPDSALETAHEILEEWERETYQEDVSTETFDGRTWEIPVADFVKAIQGTDAAKFIELYE